MVRVMCSSLLAAVSVAVLSGPAPAERLFCADISTDELVIIESTNGQVVQVVGSLLGPLGQNIITMEALTTTSTGLLYGICRTSQGYYLVEISRTSGAITRAMQLGVIIIEGLADDPMTEQLYVTYSSTSGSSDRLGRIDRTTGAITDQGALQIAGGEGDEIRFSDQGDLYLVDALCCGSGSVLWRRGESAWTYLGTCVADYSYIGTAEFLTTGDLIGMDWVVDQLVTLSLVNGSVLAAVPLQSASLMGLARVESGPVAVNRSSWGGVKALYR